MQYYCYMLYLPRIKSSRIPDLGRGRVRTGGSACLFYNLLS